MTWLTKTVMLVAVVLIAVAACGGPEDDDAAAAFALCERVDAVHNARVDGLRDAVVAYNEIVAIDQDAYGSDIGVYTRPWRLAVADYVGGDESAGPQVRTTAASLRRVCEQHGWEQT